MKRRGKWAKRVTISSSGWKFASDEESHVVSSNQYPQTKLTGPTAGRQIWYKESLSTITHHEKNETFSVAENPNSADKLLRTFMISQWKGPIPNEKTKPKNAREASIKALSFYQMLQCEDGHWAGDYGGPMFLMPGLITTLYITKAPFPDWKKEGMIAYLKNHQQEDGGWGTHIECARYVVNNE